MSVDRFEFCTTHLLLQNICGGSSERKLLYHYWFERAVQWISSIPFIFCSSCGFFFFWVCFPLELFGGGWLGREREKITPLKRQLYEMYRVTQA